jgi:hypothetical protein
MTDLFTNEEFSSFVQEEVDNSTTDVVRRIAAGWLKAVTGLSGLAIPVDDQLFGWGLELAAIAYRNPGGLASEAVDDYNATWDRSRRGAILAAARLAYGGAGTPLYAFPDADWHWTVVPVVPAILN